MLHSLLIAGVAIVALMLVWVLVQAGWRRVFADQLVDEDVLAERRSCGGCEGCGRCG